jgi:hypothetical protein
MTTTVLSSIIGKIITKVDQRRDEIFIDCSDGSKFHMSHCQDCCEDVSIEDVTGDWTDLIGHPILVAEERTKDDEDCCEMGMWTFYCFRTIKGSVDIRWYGSSNGYYSVDVDFAQIA